jgi:hypothetical protein
MPNFVFEDCLLKHYIRKEVWLPFCRERLNGIRAAAKKAKKEPRRLRYFTFCAVGALDVLLLDRERVIRRSKSTAEFDTVFFFDKNEESVIETRKRIPGATGFPGDFSDIVLQAIDGDEELDLSIPRDLPDTRETRQRQMKKAQLGAFIKSFPFDVVNLDVEQYLFRSGEKLPGILTNAMRRIFEWQRRPGIGPKDKLFTLDAFTLMFTTQVGPPGLSHAYIAYLRDDCIQRNLNEHQELENPFLKKSSGKTAAQFFADDFDGAFKLSVPKSLSELALEQDWFIDDDRGIEVYQFDRPSKDGPYRMLHMAMAVHRQHPPKENRAPGQQAEAALGAHKNTVAKIFDEDVMAVETLVTGKLKAELQADLDLLFKHRDKYYKPPAD